MSKKNLRTRLPALFASVLVPLSGCSLFPPTLEEQGIVQIQTEGTEEIHFETTSAYAEDDGFELRGTVHRFGSGHPRSIGGHVDVLIRTAAGDEQETLGIRLIPKVRPRHTGRKAFFVTRFDALPTRGTVLVVTYHEGSHPLGPSASATIDTNGLTLKSSAVQPSRSQM